MDARLLLEPLRGFEPVDAISGPIQWRKPLDSPVGHVVSTYEIILRMDVNHNRIVDACIRAAQAIGMRIDRQHLSSGYLLGTRVESLWHPTEWKWAHFCLSVSRSQYAWTAGQALCVRSLCIQFIAEEKRPTGIDGFFDRKGRADLEIATTRGRERTATVLQALAGIVTEQQMLIVHTPDWDGSIIDPRRSRADLFEAQSLDSRARPVNDDSQVLIELDEQFADALCARCIQIANEAALETLRPMQDMLQTLEKESSMLEILLQLPYQYASIEAPTNPASNGSRTDVRLDSVRAPPVSKRWLIKLKALVSGSTSEDESGNGFLALPEQKLPFGLALLVATDRLCQQVSVECEAQAEAATKVLVDQVKQDVVATEAYRSELVRRMAEAVPSSWEKVKYTTPAPAHDEMLENNGDEDSHMSVRDRFSFRRISASFSNAMSKERSDAQAALSAVQQFEESFGLCREYIVLDKSCLFMATYGKLFITKSSLWLIAGVRALGIEKKQIIPISSIGGVDVSQGVSLAPSLFVQLAATDDVISIGFPGESRTYVDTLRILIQELRKLDYGGHIQTVVV